MELETRCLIARKLSYSTETQLEPILRSTAELGRMLAGLISKLKARRDGRTPATRTET
jgi:four helix bundle protein